MYIRRDKSNLHFGRRSRRRGSRTLLVIWAITMFFAVAVIWRFDSVQSWVLAGLEGDSTPTLDPITLAQMAERAYLVGDLETAINRYEAAVEMQPNNMDLVFELGRVLIYRSYDGRSYGFRAEQALELAERAVEAAPEDPQAQAILCYALLENNRAEEAIQAGLRATELAPGFAEAHAYLSYAYYQAGRPNQALTEGDLAVKANANSVDAHRALALALSYQGNYSAAIQQYEEAIQIHSRLDALYYELALYYIAQENYDAASMAYDQVLVHDKESVKAYTKKCELYFRMREDQLAQEACEQAVQLDPTYPEAYRQLGMVQYTRRNFEGSIESMETCARLQTEQGVPLEDQEIQCYYIRGLAYTLLDDCANGWEVLNRALLMNPSEQVKGFIRQGLQLCVNYDEEYSLEEIPTPIPPTPIPPEPIGVF